MTRGANQTYDRECYVETVTRLYAGADEVRRGVYAEEIAAEMEVSFHTALNHLGQLVGSGALETAQDTNNATGQPRTVYRPAD